jgi:hypothetical protein
MQAQAARAGAPRHDFGVGGRGSAPVFVIGSSMRRSYELVVMRRS